MRMISAWVYSSILAVSCSPAIANDWRDCAQERNMTVAVQGCTRIIRKDRQNLSAYYHRARAYGKLGRFQRAIADWQSYIRLDRGSSFAYVQRGILHLQLGQGEWALNDFQTAVRLNPHNSQALLHRGIIRQRRGDISGAIADFSRAIALEPENARLLSHRAIAYHKAGKTEQALADAQRFSQLIDPGDAVSLRVSWQMLGMVGRGKALKAELLGGQQSRRLR